MTTEKYIELAKEIVSGGDVKKVFHSVELVADEKGVKFPVYKTGSEEHYIGPDDTKDLFAYIRLTGPVLVVDTKKEGSEKNAYQLQCPLRIVYFHHNEDRDFDAMIKKLLNVAFAAGVSLVRYYHNAFELAQQESPIGIFDFDATTFYLAIDINLKFWINKSDCEVDTCIKHPNPICQS